VGECGCKVCTRSRRWLAALNPQTAEAKAAMEEIESLLEHAETSASYWEMKFNGTWDIPEPVPFQASDAGEHTK
jgi:hypothetical protein